MSHTRGPWHCDQYGAIRSSDGKAVAQAGVVDNKVEESVSNGLLLAAAPELLEACEAALPEICDGLGGLTVLIEQLEAAIAKAKGE